MDIDVTQSGNSIYAQEGDESNNPFTLSGTVIEDAVSFTISGGGINPCLPTPNHVTNYYGVIDGEHITGIFVGGGSGTFENATGVLVTETYTWEGTFIVGFRPKITSFLVTNNYWVYPDEQVSYGQEVTASVKHPLGSNKIDSALIVVTDPTGNALPFIEQLSPNTYLWFEKEQPTPPAFGPYTIEVTDVSGQIGKFTSVPTNHISNRAPNIIYPINYGYVTTPTPTFEWEPFSTSTDGYWIEVYGGDFAWESGLPATQTEITVPELVDGTTYELIITAYEEHEIDNIQSYADSSTRSIEFTYSPLDFNITEIKPVQVVWDSDIDGDSIIDLVAGKSTMVRVEVGMVGHELLNNQQSVEVKLTFDGIEYSESRTIEQLLKDNKNIDFYMTSPAMAGDRTIIAEVDIAEVDPENKIEESDEKNNLNDILVTILNTHDLHIVYVPISSPKKGGGYGPLDMKQYSTTTRMGSQFIKATYPIAEIRIDTNKKKFKGNTTNTLKGALTDAKNIYDMTVSKLKLSPSEKKNVVVIGIVPDDYFIYHGMVNKDGVFYFNHAGEKFALIKNGYWTTAAHETGHMFGLKLNGEEYATHPPGNRADGFFVQDQLEINNGYCFMGSDKLQYSFFGDKNRHTHTYRHIWVDNDDYEQLFRAFI